VGSQCSQLQSADCYEAGDHIFLFGFRRGAFTVRALAGLIRCVGLLFRRARDVKGALTGRGYAFLGYGARVVVDARDAPSLTTMPSLQRVVR
jgi:T6SS, Phospholipase effector Tle1-like, catalytic domain